MQPMLRALTLACCLALGAAAAPAAAAPVTLVPGESLLFNIDATSVTYDSLILFGDVPDVQPGDFYVAALFGELDGDVTGLFNASISDTAGNDVPLIEAVGFDFLNDGVLSVSFGSASGITFDDLRLVLFQMGTEVSVFPLPPQGTVPEPGTAALVALSVALMWLRRQRSAASAKA